MEKHEGMMHNLVATDFRGQVPFSKDSRDPLISTDLYILLLKKESRPVGTENNSEFRTHRTRCAERSLACILRAGKRTKSGYNYKSTESKISGDLRSEVFA